MCCRVRELNGVKGTEVLKGPDENPLRLVCELRASCSEEGTDEKSGGRLCILLMVLYSCCEVAVLCVYGSAESGGEARKLGKMLVVPGESGRDGC